MAPDWPPAQVLQNGWLLILLPSLGLLGAAIVGHLARSRAAEPQGRRLALAAVAALHLVGIAGLVWLAFSLPDPRGHAYAATSLALVLYLLIHAGVGALMSLYAIYRDLAGYVSARRSADLRIGVLWNDFSAGAGLIGLLLIALLPELAGMRQ